MVSPTDKARDSSRERQVAAVRRLIGMGRLDTSTAAGLLMELATTENPRDVDIAGRAGLDAAVVAEAGAAVLASADSPASHADVKPTPASWIPTAIGRYEVLGAPRPCSGGFVLPARDPSAARAVAITVLATTDSSHRRLEHAARTAAGLGEPDFAPIHDVQADVIRHEPLPPVLKTRAGPSRHLVLITRAADHEPTAELGARLGAWLARPTATRSTELERGLPSSTGVCSPARWILEVLLLLVTLALALAALYGLLSARS